MEASLDVIQGQFHNEMMSNLSKIEDANRYYNWYHGYTEITYPYMYANQVDYYVSTYATYGNISTKDFDERFDSDKVDSYIYIQISVKVPSSVVGEKNITLMLDVNKKTMKELSNNEYDNMFFCDLGWDCSTGIAANIKYWSKNITALKGGYCGIQLDRKVSKDEIRDMKLDMMPGFRFTWNYDKHLEPEAYYRNEVKTTEFVKYPK